MYGDREDRKQQQCDTRRRAPASENAFADNNESPSRHIRTALGASLAGATRQVVPAPPAESRRSTSSWPQPGEEQPHAAQCE
jgi:hypothetical protein